MNQNANHIVTEARGWPACLLSLVTSITIWLSSLLNISHNHISLSLSQLQGKRARLTLFNLSYNYSPTVLKDGVVCSSCTEVIWNGNLSFNITGFSSYSSASNSYLTGLVTNRYNNKVIPNEVVYIEANYTNRTSAEAIIGSCTVNYTNGTRYVSAMTYNGTRKVYQTLTSYSLVGMYDYSINCSATGFEALNYDSYANVQLNATLFTLNRTLVGLMHRPSVVVSDLYGDGVEDVIVTGYASPTYIGAVYLNGTLENESIEGIIYSSMSIVDIDNDNKTEIIEIGKRSGSNDPVVFIYNQS